MEKTKFEIQLPLAFLQFGWDTPQIQKRLEEWIVFSLFTEGHISSGKAAKFLQMTRIDFLDLLKRRGIAYLNYTEEELEEELSSVQNLNLHSIS